MNIQNESKIEEPPLAAAKGRTTRLYFGLLAAVVVFAVVIVLSLQFRQNKATVIEEKSNSETGTTAAPNVVQIDPSAVQQSISVSPVQWHPVKTSVAVTGNIEPNQLAVQQITPLTAGRVEHVYVTLGNFVRRGTLLVTISSPSVAELHGKLHEAETRLQLAQQNLSRVQQQANKVGVLKAKADLDQAEATLNRVRSLVTEGLAPKKDLEAAETELKRAKADYDFQINIPLNREISDAKGEVATATAEVLHTRNALSAQGAEVEDSPKQKGEHDISIIALRAPISGSVIERFVNPGAGVEAGKPLLTLADTSTLWVIANVPEAQINTLRTGMAATVIPQNNQSAKIVGRINYIDPRVSEETRTASVRVEVPNPGGLLKVGGFARVEFSNSLGTAATIAVPGDSVQRMEGQPVIFVVKKGKPNEFEPRSVVLGKELESGLIEVQSGLQAGEEIVTKGAFILKSRMQKEQIGDDD